jgi:ankyrin repeat protein
MLNSAVKRNDIGSLQALLLNLNTTTKERDAVGNTPLHLAVCMNNIAMVQLLASKIPLHLQDFESGYTPLHKVHCSVDKRHFIWVI